MSSPAKRRGSDYEDLAARMKGGNDEARRAFLSEFGPLLRRFFILRGLSEADAEDEAVNCIHHIVMSIDKFHSRGKGSFMGWWRKIARNMLSDFYRRHDRPSTVRIQSSVPEPAEPAGHVGSHGLQQVVIEGLAALSERDREIVELRHFQPADSFGEIANLLGISENAARVRYHRARNRLIDLLKSAPVVQNWLEKVPQQEDAS